MLVRAVRTAGIQYVRTVFKAAKNSSLFCEIFALFLCVRPWNFSLFFAFRAAFFNDYTSFLVKKS